MLCLSLVVSRTTMVVALACILSAPVTAQTSQVQSEKGSTATGSGDANLKVSRVYIFVDKTGLGHQHAIEGKLTSGKLFLGADSSAGRLVFDMRSFDADTAAARRYIGLQGVTDASTRSKVNANMRGSGVLDVQKYPQAIFEITSALPTGNSSKRGLPTYEIVGSFRLHGTTRPARIVAEVEQARGWLHVRGNFAIRQTSYGITPFSKAFGAIGVTDALRIHGDLWIAPNPRTSMNEIPERK